MTTFEPVGPERPDPKHVRAVTVSLRRVILAGEQFRNNRARELRLSPSDIVALEYLHDNGSALPRELSSALGVTSGTMTALLDRVEKAGFLRRESNPEDRRSLLILLTPAGEHAVQWLYEQFDEALSQILTALPAAVTPALPEALEQLSLALAEGS